MEFKAITTKYNYGDRLLHRFPDMRTKLIKEEVLVVKRVSVSYGIKVSGAKKPETFIEYICESESGKNCSTGCSFSFQEGDYNDTKYITLIR